MAGEQTLPTMTALGGDTPGGTYLLRMQVARPLTLRFGRFRGGKLIAVPAGDYLYVGSALAQTGAMRLAPRLVRHATRSGDQPPHAIRADLIEFLQHIGLSDGNRPPLQGKQLFWNVDYLLDAPATHLTNIILIRSPRRLEPTLARHLEADPHTHILEKGLGANDVPGNTHLLRVTAAEIWWHDLPNRINRFLES
jgi:Uri superfamily endonuclease